MTPRRKPLSASPSSSGRKARSATLGCTVTLAAPKTSRTHPPISQPPVAAEPLNDPAVTAMLDWDARWRPEAEIIFDADVPKLTNEQLREFRPARFRIGRGRHQG